MQWTPGVVVAVAFWAAACGGNEDRGAAFTVTDSAGVSVVWSAAPAWDDDAGWRIGEVELAVGGDAIDLFQVAGAVRMGGGGVVVADGGTSRLLFFDAAGALQGEAGGEGDGPGEFRIIQRIGVTAQDSVWVYDFSHRRISTYGPDRRLAGTVSLEPPLSTAALAGRWPDGSYLVTQLWGESRSESLSPGLARDPVVYARYTEDGVLVDTVASSLGREVLLRPEGGRMTMGTPPFARDATYAPLDDGLVVGDAVGYELRVLEAEGHLRRIIRWAGPALELGPGEVDAWKESQVASARAADRSSVRAYLADVPIPPLRPAYGSLLAGPLGSVWVGAYAQPGDVPARWDVFDTEGVWLGPVRMPPGFRPVQVGDDWVVGLARDAMGVERVEVRELLRDLPADPG